MNSSAHRLLAEDAAAREAALDVSRSFLVQAPAGSGKTELLIQRYLALLARVDRPESIVALTFTRKAAGVMRERVALALRAAYGGQEPTAPHERITYTLARAAIEHDARRGWSLIDHASRMRITTFDALATDIADRAPIAARLGPHPAYVDDATALYREAAEAVIARAAAEDRSMRTLLLHVDNNAPRLANLLSQLLARRDQWLRQVERSTREKLLAGLEQAIRDEIVDVLRTSRRMFPEGIGAEICARASDAAQALVHGDPNALAAAVDACRGGLPAATVDALPQWKALARFLMVKSCENFKKSLSASDGFVAIGNGVGAEARRARKAAMESLCAKLNATPGLAKSLAMASRLPAPAVAESSWCIVQALLDVLRRAAAELVTVFARRKQLDFLEANLAAIRAIGEPDAPSDLLLRLDATIQHVLVDEFQDTSLVQLDLLRGIIAGWQPDDGRTLFAVGDPMQSIYRFREAEVRFFIDAQQVRAIGDVPVDVLRLRRNFRSQADLVSWSNAAFATVLGDTSNPVLGIVGFEPAVAVRAATTAGDATLDLCATRRDEAAKVVDRIRAAQAAGDSSIAVLVRARGHLTEILPALRAAHIDFAAVELDRLADRQVIIDLSALTQALCQPAARTAWLAVLRAPWCGLTLADLFVVVDAIEGDRRAPLLPVLSDDAMLARLSAEGRKRLSRTSEVLHAASAMSGRAGIADRVRAAWLALGGPAVVDDPIDIEAALLYFDLLQSHEQGGELNDRASFLHALEIQRATPGADVAGVQVMTMHKAKGLQFDAVILPGLAADANPGDRPLLRWRARDRGLLIAPDNARGEEAEPLYDHLARLEKDAEDAELGRLLYVACTRAKNRLHLIGVADIATDKKTGVVDWKNPASSSSLRKLWPALAAKMPPLREPSVAAASTTLDAPALVRLPLDYRGLPMDDGVEPLPFSDRDVAALPFDWVRESTRLIGTIAHRWLAKLAAEGIDAWPEARVAGLANRLRGELATVGFAHDELPPAVEKTLSAVRRTLADPRGRWLFDTAHADARSEWALCGVDGGDVVRVVVDRTFVANGERWIVDFKTGTHEGGDVETFLDREVERYREAMTRYARIMHNIDPRPVRLALYYPLIANGFREIVAVPAVRGQKASAKVEQLSLNFR
ncbi:MAG TPA: UvrD-helicase domain-containing protein [Casimicrobiaceae bacterium]|nr:UvrD-helicase domain-containing protein [Casimicrobiaceae bacterium]